MSQVHFHIMNTLGTEVAVLNSQGVPISQVVLKTGFTVCMFYVSYHRNGSGIVGFKNTDEHKSCIT